MSQTPSPSEYRFDSHTDSSDMSNAKICIKNLSKSFGEKEVLKDVSLTIPQSRSLVVIGGSGMGKSVLLKSILGIVQPDSGEIEIDGVDILSDRRAGDKKRRQIGMLFQGAALFDSMRVWENVSFRLTHGEGMKRREAKELAVNALSKVGLNEDVGDLYPSEISGGMQKRVGLARAVAAKPEILFFDEPTTGLDPIMADVINNLISEQVHRLGATAISITHDMASAMKIGDQIAMLHQGRIVWQGPPSTINNSGNAMVDQFINGRADGPIAVDR